MAQSDEKRCAKCGEHWPADREFFYADQRRRDGLRCVCKACCRDYPSERGRTAHGARASDHQHSAGAAI